MCSTMAELTSENFDPDEYACAHFLARSFLFTFGINVHAEICTVSSSQKKFRVHLLLVLN